MAHNELRKTRSQQPVTYKIIRSFACTTVFFDKQQPAGQLQLKVSISSCSTQEKCGYCQQQNYYGPQHNTLTVPTVN